MTRMIRKLPPAARLKSRLQSACGPFLSAVLSVGILGLALWYAAPDAFQSPPAHKLGPDASKINPANLDAAELECLALNIYHEARGEPEAGQVAVAQVVLNRVVDRRFPGTICAVVKQGARPKRRDCQFSWWCDGRSDRPADLGAWHAAKSLAGDVVAGRHPDPTGGALWYHADDVAPEWRKTFAPAAEIGRHRFYLPMADTAR